MLTREPFEELLVKLYKLQPVMISISTKKNDLSEDSAIYEELVSEIVLDIEFLQDEGFTIANPILHSTTQSWLNYSSSLGGNSERRQYVGEIFDEFSSYIENSLISWKVSDLNSFDLAKNDIAILLSSINEISDIMKEVSTDMYVDILDEEEGYLEKYEKTLRLIWRFQAVGMNLVNPNKFTSLWLWYEFYASEGLSTAERKQYVDDVYRDMTSILNLAIRKHERKSTSNSDLFEDIKRRLKDKSGVKKNAKIGGNLPPGILNPERILNSETIADKTPVTNVKAFSDRSLDQIVHAEPQSVDEEPESIRDLSQTKRLRVSLSSFMTQMPSSQFGEVLFVLEVPLGCIPGDSAPQQKRVIALLEWAEGSTGCGLDEVQSLLKMKYDAKF